MNRVIKFRAWDKQTESMYYDMLIGPENHGDRWCIMQLTGLNDPQGVVIYEGDILRSDTKYNDDGYGVFLVCFHNGIFFAKRCYEDDGFDDYTLSDAEYYFDDSFINDSPPLHVLLKEDVISVIGNLFESRSLLTK